MAYLDMSVHTYSTLLRPACRTSHPADLTVLTAIPRLVSSRLEAILGDDTDGAACNVWRRRPWEEATSHGAVIASPLPPSPSPTHRLTLDAAGNIASFAAGWCSSTTADHAAPPP
ncbi:predicted protein [Plenodomus lingam JN3]|uniref:Predicted protein n=1 Tax=Leptosphaeria maculans (strain JN3 / isolate v23.1.3 / race Av1-4-5-6-7-8) TaxID=985895 RepID=E5A2J9_LEPMJ|nr:predicted protein [Plenodomus lingam JN3]CBX97795.1 predicted protein [Plenodomus lingam JN3]